MEEEHIAQNIIEMVKIPAARVQALKGDANFTLKMLEEKLGVLLDIGEDGEVEIEGESINVFFAIPVIQAIGRGFEPRIALKLKNDEFALKIVDLNDFAKNSRALTRIKGRIIGEGGKTRQVIEQEAEVDLAIYGHTVGIIGKLDVIDIAANAVFKLAEGTTHAGVYFYLEKNKRRRKEEEIKGKAKMK